MRRALPFPGLPVAAGLLAGCDGGTVPAAPGATQPQVTEVYGVRGGAGTVRAGQEVEFRALVRDSADRTLRYTWTLSTAPVGPADAITATTGAPVVQWRAPLQTGRYRHGVLITRPDGPGVPVSADFFVLVAP